MAVIIGNRGFFPDQLAKTVREEMMRTLTKAGMDSVVPIPRESKHGTVETHEGAKRGVALLQKNRLKNRRGDRAAAELRRGAPSETRCAWRLLA